MPEPAKLNPVGIPAAMPGSSIAASGRELSNFWREDRLQNLHPAEQRLLDCAIAGQACLINDSTPSSKSSTNCVRAEFLRFLALGGDTDNRPHEQGIRLQGAIIEGDLTFAGAQLGHNLVLHNCGILGDLDLQDCQAKSISLPGSQLDGIQGDRFVCEGNFHLSQGFRAGNEVSLCGAVIAGDLDCRDGRFLADGTALSAQGSKISGNCYLDEGFFAKGMVALSDCHLGGGLSCKGGTFSCRDQAIMAARLTVANNVDLGEGCQVAGQISLQGAVIGGDLIFTGGAFDRRVKWEKIHDITCINLRNARIAGTLFWRQITIARGELNLAGAACRTLNMDRGSWEKPAQIRLDNFTYKGFNQLDETTSASFWLDWIDRQPLSHLTRKFRPKPYQQLADVLQSMGHEEEARVIRIERRRRQAEYVRHFEKPSTDPVRRHYRKLTGFWNHVQGYTVGYGYRPGNAMIWLILLSLVGALFYQVAAVNGIMTPTHPLIYKEAVWDGSTGPLVAPEIPTECHRNWVYPSGTNAGLCSRSIPSEYSTFNALIYSLDVAIPVVDLRMQSDWSPRVVNWQTGETDWGGWWVRSWEWLQILLGWALSLLFVSAIGGIIRRD